MEKNFCSDISSKIFRRTWFAISAMSSFCTAGLVYWIVWIENLLCSFKRASSNCIKLLSGSLRELTVSCNSKCGHIIKKASANTGMNIKLHTVHQNACSGRISQQTVFIWLPGDGINKYLQPTCKVMNKPSCKLSHVELCSALIVDVETWSHILTAHSSQAAPACDACLGVQLLRVYWVLLSQHLPLIDGTFRVC